MTALAPQDWAWTAKSTAEGRTSLGEDRVVVGRRNIDGNLAIHIRQRNGEHVVAIRSSRNGARLIDAKTGDFKVASKAGERSGVNSTGVGSGADRHQGGSNSERTNAGQE